MQRVSEEEAKIRLADLIEAALNGEEILIIKDEQHSVKLVPVEQPKPKPRPQFGSAKGVVIEMTEDFDAHLEDFKELEPVEQPKPLTRRKFGSFKGQIEMSDDFDEPLEDFKDYM